MTALENVAYPLMLNGFSRRDQHKLAHDMLTKVGLEAVMQQRPDHLSGGQQQRVAIARALVHNPKLVVADEPTASLDSQTANLVISLMKSLGHELGTTLWLPLMTGAWQLSAIAPSIWWTDKFHWRRCNGQVDLTSMAIGGVKPAA